MHTEETMETIAALERAPTIVVPLIRQASPASVKRRPPSGKWSIHEQACHLAAVHPLFFQRLGLGSYDRISLRKDWPAPDA